MGFEMELLDLFEYCIVKCGTFNVWRVFLWMVMLHAFFTIDTSEINVLVSRVHYIIL